MHFFVFSCIQFLAKNKISESLNESFHRLADLWNDRLSGPRQANLVLIAYGSSEGSGEPTHPRSLARTSAARSYKQWVKRHLQTESQITGPSEWLDMYSWNLSWGSTRRHKFTWRNTSVLSYHFAYFFTFLLFLLHTNTSDNMLKSLHSTVLHR